ncbi:MAG: polysaccharide biosynthesis/export family protein [Opitutales bacterium]|nr:polysaccharide biosynthesis/export family protein [Opitutales bacterium]
MIYRITTFFLIKILFFSVGIWAQPAEPEQEGLLADGRLAEPDSYLLNAGDLIQVIVFQEPDLNREVRISQNGRVQLPLVGSVDLAGNTVQEATERIFDLYEGDFLINPQINITVLEYSQRRVNVMGEVNSPGTIMFPPEESMTIIDAISRAGGPNSLGNLRRVSLIRKTEEGEMENFTINVDEIMSGNSDVLWVLQKDDTIVVPRRRI